MLSAAALNFVVDPLQLFRPARLFAAMYSPDSRMQNAGLIRSQEFDTVFMGTSLAIHFRQSEIDRVLGVKIAKTGDDRIELGGAELCAGRVAFRVRQKCDLAGGRLDFPRRAGYRRHDIYLPADLYRRNARGVAGYLFNGAMVRESAWIIARSIPPIAPMVALPTAELVFTFTIARPY